MYCIYDYTIMDHHYNIVGTSRNLISLDRNRKKKGSNRLAAEERRGEVLEQSDANSNNQKEDLKSINQFAWLRLRPNSPPARHAAAPVRGGLEPGCMNVERSHCKKSSWNYFEDWKYRQKIQKYGRKWNDRPLLPHLWPPGVDSRGVGCGDNWTGGGGLRGKRLTEVTQLMDIKTPRPLDIMRESENARKQTRWKF